MNLSEICRKTAEIAVQTGEFISAESLKFERSQTEIKSLNSLVSYVDKEAEAMIVDKLQKILPEAGFIAEEGTGEENLTGLNWVIDPLDGTTNFIHGIPTYAVSIALLDGKNPLLGVVHEVNRRECFYAHQNGGAFLNGKKIYVSNVRNIKEALVATGFPYTRFEKQAEYMNLLKYMMQSCRGLRRIGSAAVDLAYVSAGRFEAFYEYNLNSWDVAAGVCLVREAGGTVTDFSGTDNPIFGGEILAGCEIYGEILQIIRNHFRLDE
jgi:myo-inositol-1(or 4)-monophosphatase